VSTATEPDGLKRPTNDQELKQFLERAENGDTATIPLLREMLQNSTDMRTIGGDLAQIAEKALIDSVGGKNLLFKEALTRKLELLRAELAGTKPTPVENLLVERIVMCWLQVQHAELWYAQQAGNLSLAHYHQDRLDRAHRRYLSALKTLALIRKLAVPVLQVNLAQNQVNVAGPPE
jgi:hypothetical protein